MRPTDAMEHPPDWSVTTVRKAVEIRRGLSWSKDQERSTANNDTVPVLRITNVKSELNLTDILYLTGVPEKAREKKKATKDWSVVVGSNGNRERIGNAVRILEDSDFLFASFLLAVKPREGTGITPEFFNRWLTSHPVQSRLSASAEGSTGLSNLAHAFFKAMEIAYPDGNEQTAIANILDAVDEAIKRTRTTLEKARRLKRGILQKAFSSDHAHVEKLKTFVTDIRYGTSQASNDKRWGYPTLRIPNIIGGIINTSDLTYVNASTTDAKRYLLKEDDILLVRTNGNPAYIGRSAVFHPPDEKEWLYASYLIRVRFNDNLYARYIDEYLKSERGRRELMKRVTTSAGNYNINTKSILTIPFPYQDKTEQAETIALTDTANVQISRFENELTALEKLKKGLMQDLLTGKVRVKQLAAAESASD